MAPRIASLEEFWSHYLGEHRDPLSRKLHFVGTTGWFASIAASTLLSPIAFPLAMAGFGIALKKGLASEKERPAFLESAVMIALPSLAAPLTFPVGVAFAYGCAWAGHFGLEKNRPATFHYPLYSLVSDWKMWAEMARGRLWQGDPVEELGLEPAPAANGNGATTATVLH
jgi:hypothetical protein